MELSGTGRAGRNGAVTQAAQKAVRTGTPARAARAPVEADRMTLSRQALCGGAEPAHPGAGPAGAERQE